MSTRVGILALGRGQMVIQTTPKQNLNLKLCTKPSTKIINFISPTGEGVLSLGYGQNGHIVLMHIMEELIYEFKYLILLLNIFRKEMKLFIKVKDMKTFWQEFGEEVTFHSHAYQTQKKPKQFLKNWRPISLF